jgi:hypothetical protein
MKDRIVSALVTVALVIALGLPWLVGVIVGAFKLAFIVGHKTGFDGLALLLTAETPKAGRR